MPRCRRTKCTFQVTIESQNQVGSNDLPANPGEEGLYLFLVDGLAPSPGPTDGSGFYAWSIFQGASAITGTSYAVTAKVANTSANQVHSIVVGIGCNEILGDSTGCFGAAGFSNLQIARYH